MAPPAGYAAEAHQASRLSGDAVCGDQLLLLAKSVEEAKGVCAEANDRHDCQQRECAERACRHARALSPRGGREHHEGDHQAG
jgi:hypothetical protein